VLLALLLTEWLVSPIPSEVETKARHIRPGMAFDQAEKNLGEDSGGAVRGGHLTLVWTREDGTVCVSFDPHGSVNTRECSREGARASPAARHRLRSWLDWCRASREPIRLAGWTPRPSATARSPPGLRWPPKGRPAAAPDGGAA